MKKIYKNMDSLGKLLFVVIVVLAVLGDGFKFYNRFFWWDLLLHFISGIYFICVGLAIAKAVPGLGLKHMLIFSFAFALASHVSWEIFEFACDLIFSSNMQRWHLDPSLPDTYGRIISVRTPGVIDTMTDFIANIAGALLACIVRCSKRKKN